MATATSHNKKSSAVKRILSEARELANDSSDLYSASPLEDNMFEWHFTLRGPANTEFANGLYHGRILLPAEYPMRPPNLMLLTPNGRWELNKKICLTFTGFHEEMWQPAWGIRTALLGLQTFMTAKAEAAVGIGALDYPVQAREKLAKESRKWTCDVCAKTTLELLPDPDPEQETKQEALPDGLCVDLTAQSHKSQPSASASTSTSTSTPAAGPDAAARPIITTAATSEEPPAPVAAPTPPPPAPIAAAAPAAPTLPAPARLRPSFNAALPPHTSATQRKLSLIDNCIKALSVLVALLVVKRLI
ncbi:hypothetical protein PaG_06377 [Moesziomyces aphidis]|jgi:ubiquitin-conjugating enzyme E2 J1|uniref:UBC core domain-containing protein n=1 Tax=Moesziomyces aphidis TaxID=84754 RepID=W3VD46_MOEAP|nr:hypothetical protein PaG_06377 [Moesziomyces aphidis]